MNRFPLTTHRKFKKALGSRRRSARTIRVQAQAITKLNVRVEDLERRIQRLESEVS